MRIPLSIAAKLTISACWTVGLLVGLAVLVRLSTIHLAAVETVGATAAAAELEVTEAALAAEEMRTISRELPFQQTVQEVDRSLESAMAKSKVVMTHLNKAMTATSPTATGIRSLPTEELNRLVAVLQKEAHLRRDLLAVRGGPFWRLHEEVGITAAQIRSQFVLEDLSTNEIEDLISSLSDYQAHVDAIVYATMSFLATKDVRFSHRAAEAMAMCRARMAEMTAIHLSSYTLRNLQHLEEKRLVFEDTAHQLLQSIDLMDRQISEEVEPANTAMTARLGEIQRQIADSATVAFNNAVVARGDLLSYNLSLTGGALLLLMITHCVVLRSIVHPVRSLTRLMKAMADGEIDKPVEFKNRRDEIGAMMRALETLRRSVQGAVVQSQMIRQLPIGVMTTAPGKGSLLAYVNPEAQRLLGTIAAQLPRPPAEMVGQPTDFLGSTKLRQFRYDVQAACNVERIFIGTEAFDLGISPLIHPSDTGPSAMLTLVPRSKQVDLVNRFESSIAQFADSLSQSSISVCDTAASMRAVAVEGLEQTLAVANATDQATLQTQEISSVIEKLVASIGEIAGKIELSLSTASRAAGEATLADDSVDKLGEAADQIGGIVRLISTIAVRTKLLALNAAIEAARAGESGRGFAVVATEVKTLAMESAIAARDVSNHIAAMQATARQTMHVLQGVAAAIRHISELAAGTLDQVGKQQDALSAIVVCIRDVASGARDITGNVSGVREAVSYTDAKAQEVLNATTALSQQARILTTEAAVFLGAIQAAA